MNQFMGLDVTRSQELVDPQWDDFVASVEEGQHVQTSRWAQVKACLGWKPLRVVARCGGEVVGGAQMLIHPVAMLGLAAYVPKGPLLREPSPFVAGWIVKEIHKYCRETGVQFLSIQPANMETLFAPLFHEVGLQESTLELAPVATILVDLRGTDEEILKRMKRQGRQNIQISQRKGVQVRLGGAEDIATFYQLHCQSARRQKFLPYPKRYFEGMWQVFNQIGAAHLFFGEIDHRPVSSLLAISFNGRLSTKIIGWNGEGRECRPNEAMIWRAMQLGRDLGLRFLDFEGIDLDVAVSALQKDQKPEVDEETVPSGQMDPGYARYKFKYGGQIVLGPRAYDLVANPFFRRMYRKLQLRVGSQEFLSHLLDYFRKR